jgi:hypothetical protein
VIGLDHPFMAALMTIDSTVAQLDASEAFFDRLAQMHERLPDIRTNNNLNFLSELAA